MHWACITNQPSVLEDPSEAQHKNTQCHERQTTQLHKIGKISLGNDHCPLELWKTLPQTKQDFSSGKKYSAVLCLLTLSAQAVLTESCLLRASALGSSFLRC